MKGISLVVGGAAVVMGFINPIQGCIHDSLDHKLVDSHQSYDDHPFQVRNRKRQLEGDDVTNFQTYESSTADAYQPIRITPYYDNATLDPLPAEKRAIIFRVIPEAIRRFRNALQVVPVQGKLAAQHTCRTQWLTTPRVCKTFVPNEMCLEMVIPDEHFGATRSCSTCPKAVCASGNCAYTTANGIDNTDFLLYVRAATTDYCSTRTLAYASSCQKDQYDRPTFGMANFCPSQISTAAEDYESQVSTAMHEMTHALGFSAQFFPLMRYPDGTPRTPRDAFGKPPTYTSGTCPNGQAIEYYVEPSNNTIKHSKERGHAVSKMVTPNVAAFAQSHFNCPSLAGAELEQQDNSGCIGSHWEERIFEPEYMSPVDSFRNIFSALTLAFFEDSGWYRANTSAAQRLHFGEKRGCAFANEKCINPETTVPVASDHYCTSNTAESCSVDAISRSICTIGTGKTIPSDYQYFLSAPTKGGDDFADYCPINTGYSNGDCSNPRNLAYPGKTTINVLGESYCPTCRCTSTTLRSADSSNWIVNARRQTGCYAMRCVSKDANVSIVEMTIPRSKTNDAVKVNCTVKGERLTVPGFSGYLTCPDPFVICDSVQVYNFTEPSKTGGTSSNSGTGTATVKLRSSSAANTIYSAVARTLSLLLGFLATVVVALR